MISLVLLLCVLGLLFVMAYVTSSRFGILGLALAGGTLLSSNWAGTVTPFIQHQGVVLTVPPLELVVRVTLTLLPAIVLLFSSPSYKVQWQRVLGSFAFAFFGFAILVDFLGMILQLDQPGLSLYNFVHMYQSIIIVGGVILAVADVFFISYAKGKKREH